MSAAALGALSFIEVPRSFAASGAAAQPSAHMAPTPVAPSASSDHAPAVFTGVIASPRVVDVAAPAAGPLANVLVRMGDRVSVGQVVATLDTKQLQDELAIAKAQLAAARAERRKAQLQFTDARKRDERSEKLKKYVSVQEIETAAMTVDLAEAGTAAAASAVDQWSARATQVTRALANAELRAPFAGTVSAVFAAPGATVEPGRPIVRIVGTEGLLVRFALPEEELETVADGCTIDVELPKLGLQLTGRIVAKSPDIDVGSRTLFVEATLDLNPETAARMVVGLVANVRPRCRG